MATCKFCPSTGTDVLPTVIGRGSRPIPLCPPCRGMELEMPRSERTIARRYEQAVRLHGDLPEVVNLDEPCP